MCGEHEMIPLSTIRGRGSSPHVRGAPARYLAPLMPAGIIPACAGSTQAPGSAYCGRRDHPRMCGEHCRCDVVRVLLQGSSPHVRGAPPHA